MHLMLFPSLGSRTSVPSDSTPAQAEIMRRSGKSKPVVWRWQARFMAEGVEGLTRDKTRKPGKQPLPTRTVQRVVDLTLGPPPGEATHWTGRMLAKAAGVSLRSVQRILEAHQLAPHRIRTFKRRCGCWPTSKGRADSSPITHRLLQQNRSQIDISVDSLMPVIFDNGRFMDRPPCRASATGRVPGSARRAQDLEWAGRVSLPLTVISRFLALPLTGSVFNGHGCFPIR